MYKAALLAALGLASVTAAQATAYNGDLIVGLTTGTTNDVVYDLGSFSSLTAGQTWDLSAALTAAGIGSGSYSTLQWGVIGAKNTITKAVYTTDALTPRNITSQNFVNGIYGSAISTIFQFMPAAGAGNYIATSLFSDSTSWYSQTTAAGSSGNTSAFGQAYADPNNTGFTQAALYQVNANNSAPLANVYLSFNSSGVLTVDAVPEPGSTGLMAVGGGLLLLVGRNQFRRSNVN